MANQKDQKRKLLAILRLFVEQTDAEHPLTLSQITGELAAQDIDAERKSIYACIEALRNFGMDIQMQRTPRAAYYLAGRQFSYEEVALLLNAVQTCPSLLPADRKRLEKHVYALASKSQQKQLSGRIDAPERRFIDNKRLYASLSGIQDAMRTKRKIFFRYISLDIGGKRVFHTVGYSGLDTAHNDRNAKADTSHDAQNYMLCTPVRLAYVAGYYYAICWVLDSTSADHGGKFRTYRVDRMDDVHIAKNCPADRNATIANYQTSTREDTTFGMYVDEKGKQSVTLHIEDLPAQEKGYSWIVGSFYDKFGEDMDIRRISDTTARIRVKTVASPQFFSWLLQFGGQVKIETPRRLASRYVEEYLRPALAQYDL